MKKKLILTTTFLTGLVLSSSPIFGQIQEAQGFGALTGQPAPSAPQRSNPAAGMQNMVSAWQNERDPAKKRAIAKQIQTTLGVKADGIIGNQTLGAINQMGGMPPPNFSSAGGPSGPTMPIGQAAPAPAQGGFFSGIFGTRPAPAPQGQPGLSNMMNAWQNETDPTKKARLARQIQTRVGVKADGVIGNQTMQAIQQAGGMPGGGGMGGPGPTPGGGGFNPNPGQPAPAGGFGFNPNPGQPAGGGFLGGLFGARPNQAPAPGLTNMMNEWQMEPDPNKKRMIAMEIQRGLGVKADGVIGNQTMQAIQQAGGMPGGGGMGGPGPTPGGGGFNPNPGQPAPAGGFGFNPNPGQPKQGGFFSGIFGAKPAPQGGFGQPGVNPQGGFGQPGVNPQGGFGQPGVNPQGGFGQPGVNPQGGFGFNPSPQGASPQGDFGQPGGGMHGGGMHGGGMGMPGGGGMGGPGPMPGGGGMGMPGGGGMGGPGPGPGGPGPGDGGGGPGPGGGGEPPKP